MPDSRSLVWRRSRRCGEAGACVEIARYDGGVALRDSKNPDGAVLRFGRTEWVAFVDGLRKGDFES
jgi:hypothetical protein